jgi:hypothetical protein
MNLNLDKNTWKRSVFGDVVANVNDYYKTEVDGALPYVAGPHINPGQVTVAAYGSTDDDDFPPTFKRKFRQGDVLLHSRGIDKLAVVDRVGVTGEKLFVLRSKDDSVLRQDFLVWLMCGPASRSHMEENFTGSVNKFLNWKPLASMELDLPPIDEQKRIASLLWTVESHRGILKRLECEIRTTARNMIQDARKNAPTKPLASVARIHNGQSFPKAMQGRSTGEIPFFKIADLDGPSNHRFLTVPGNWISAEEAQTLKAEVLPPGTIVTARVGAAINLERRRALSKAGLVDDNHLVIRPHSSDSEFVLAVLSETALARSGNDGVVPSLNQKIVGAVPIPAFPPADERTLGQRYRLTLDAADSIMGELQSLLSLRSSFLSALFGDAA